MTKLDLQSDTRLIPLGALMRATGLDELPQLLNDLRGKNRTSFREMIALDIWYAGHKPLRPDLTIMARTSPTLVSQLMETRRTRPGNAAQCAGKAFPESSGCE